MSVYIAVSQAARLAAVWTRNRLVQQLLISASIISYSLLLIERNKKINKFYERDSTDQRTTRGSSQD